MIEKGDKASLLNRLAELSEVRDIEAAHLEAEKALIEFIGDRDITEAYEDLDKWYS